jgi:hypothetical protein
MESTAHFHHKIAYSILNEANSFFDHAAPFDTAVDMLDPHPTLGNQAISSLLLSCELTSTRFLGGGDGFYSLKSEGLEAQVLQKMASLWQRVRSGIGNSFIMPLSFNRITEEDDGEALIDQEHVFHRVPLFLAAVIELLIIRVLGARDHSLCSIMTKRGLLSVDVLFGVSSQEESRT